VFTCGEEFEFEGLYITGSSSLSREVVGAHRFRIQDVTGYLKSTIRLGRFNT